MAGRTITALEIQQQDKERVNVYLDGQFAFGLSRLAAAHLKTGQVLTQAEIDALCALDEVARAIDYAARLLAQSNVEGHLKQDLAPRIVQAQRRCERSEATPDHAGV